MNELITPGHQRQELFADVADILQRGYTLITKDVQEIIPHYGYGEGYADKIFMKESSTALLAAYGVHKQIDHYKGHRICRDGNLPVDQTDIEVSRASIDKVRRRDRRLYPVSEAKAAERLSARILDGPYSRTAKEIAFAKAYYNLAPHLLENARQFFDSEEDVEDVVQEIMAKAWRHANKTSFSEFQNIAFRASGWLIPNALHRQQRRPQTEPLELHEAEVHNIPAREGIPEVWTTYLETLETLRTMPAAYGEVIDLLRSNYGVQDIAKYYGISYGAAKIKIHRARRAAQKVLGAADLLPV